MGNLHLPNQIASPHNLLEKTPTFIGALILSSSSNQWQNDRIVESHRVKFNLNVVLVSKTWFWICSIYDSNWNAVLRHQQPILVWKAIFKLEKNILWFGYLIWARVFCEIKKAGSQSPVLCITNTFLNISDTSLSIRGVSRKIWVKSFGVQNNSAIPFWDAPLSDTLLSILLAVLIISIDALGKGLL